MRRVRPGMTARQALGMDKEYNRLTSPEKIRAAKEMRKKKKKGGSREFVKNFMKE